MTTIKSLAVLAAALLMITSCDDQTDTIGNSLTENNNKLNVTSAVFDVATQSILADSVLLHSNTGYLGRIKDNETGNNITASFMTQFHAMDNTLPEMSRIASIKDGKVIADSAELVLYFVKYYGDTLAPIKIRTYEMNKPVEEGKSYYSNFDPMKEGLVKTDGFKLDKMVTLHDLSVKDSLRSLSTYYHHIRIPLNTLYKDGENYGTYLMRTYYEHPEYFKNSYQFVHKVCPGFFFETIGGNGAMAAISRSDLNVYFRLKDTAKDTVYAANVIFSGTEEVLQTTVIDNDKEVLRKLTTDNTCTYLNTPAGIFTEMTLPVDEIVKGHENDTINTAKIVLSRLNYQNNNKYSLDIPQTLLMVEKDSLYTFFEKNKVTDNSQSYLASYNNSYNVYSFNNISNLVAHMHNSQKNHTGSATTEEWIKQHPNWNKVVLVPVVATYSTSLNSVTGTELTRVTNDMSLTHTRLVGGSNSSNGKVTVSVIYSKFNK